MLGIIIILDNEVNLEINKLLVYIDTKYKEPYYIYLIKSYDNSVNINNGYLMNIGYDLAKKNINHVIFLNMEQLFIGNNVKKPIYLLKPRDNDINNSSRMINHFLSISKNDFEFVKGWSNKYFSIDIELFDMLFRLNGTIKISNLNELNNIYYNWKKSFNLNNTYQYYIENKYLEYICNKYSSSLDYNNDTYLDIEYTIINKTILSNKCAKYIVNYPTACKYLGYNTFSMINKSMVKDNYFIQHQNTNCNILYLTSCILDKTKIKLGTYKKELIMGISEEY